MATQEFTTQSPLINNNSQSIARKQISLLSEHYEALAKFSKFTGTPIEELIDECVDDFIQCSIRARTEVLLKRLRKTERAAARARMQVEVDDYLMNLEADITPTPETDTEPE